jgi:hypothetical protein
LVTGETTLAFANYSLSEMNFTGGVEENSLEKKPANTELAFISDKIE